MMRSLAILGALAFLPPAPPTPVAQGTGEVGFVETSVDLRANGSAVVQYLVQWNVLRGEFHGFYFEGNDRLRVGMAVDQAYALDAAGRRYDLSITSLGRGRWDIVLADGQGVRSGTVSFVFSFVTDFAAAGYLGPTTSPDGRALEFFNWSPVQWDEASHQDHYTLSILTPHVLPPDVDPRAYVDRGQLVLTEPWVNEKFRIDYQRGEADRLRLVFHREQPGNRFDMRTQFYLPAEWFAGAAVTGPPPARTLTGLSHQTQTQLLFGLGAAALLAVFFVVMAGKQRSMVAAHAGLDDIRWDSLDWTPPKLVLSTFRKAGKVCKDLTTLEAAFYLGLPFKRILSAMLDAMIAEGFLEVLDRALRAGNDRDARLDHRAAGLGLVSHAADLVGRRPHEHDPAPIADLGELRVLGQESVAGMDRLGAGDLGRGHDPRDVQVALTAGGRPDADVLVREPDVQGVPVRLGVHGNRADAQLAARPDHP